MDIITSRKNEKIINAAKLIKSPSERKKTKLFLIEGLRLCLDAAGSGVYIKELYFTSETADKNKAETEELTKAAENVYNISNEVASKLSDTVNPAGVFCVCKMLDRDGIIDKTNSHRELAINASGKYIALENVQNPENLGSAVRTAEALGLDGLIVGGGCDIYNPKAQRAAMGSLLRLPVFETDDLPCFLRECTAKGMMTAAAVLDEEAVSVDKFDFSLPSVIVIGNEGRGISNEVIAACEKKTTIPMAGRAQSLNAAASAAIIMWEMSKR
ncbi:MAG: RNA methyltransferase [Oscillospiraceae bacterium]|nr:RNA methyltransferase [Oscillospiraceae bacterium]